MALTCGQSSSPYAGDDSSGRGADPEVRGQLVVDLLDDGRVARPSRLLECEKTPKKSISFILQS